jgi:predicted MPP superfamily phosphohydrolase
MRILHCSDLHIEAQADFGQELIIQRMLEDVQIAASTSPFDVVIFSGDLASSGQRAELDRALDLLIAPLKELLDIPAGRFVIVPGNHDVDRTVISHFLEPGLREILNSTEQVDSLAVNEVEFAAAMRRLDAWSSFEDDFYQDSGVVNLSRLANAHPPEICNGSYGVAALNSAWRATGAPENGDRGYLLVSESHAFKALEYIQSASVRLVVMHHPLHWLADWNHSLLRIELERRRTLVLTGHEHVADPQSTVSIRGEALYLPTGCLYQGRRLPIAYSIIDVDDRDHWANVQLRSWKEARAEFDRGTEYLENGEKRFDLPRESTFSLVPRPAYTLVTNSLVEVARTTDSFSELLDETEPAGLFDIIVEPRFFPAPFSQVAAAVAFAHSQGKSTPHLATIHLAGCLIDTRVAIVSGDALSGVSRALLWLLADHFERDATRVPIPVSYRKLAGHDPIDRLIRATAPAFGVAVNPRVPLPPLAVAIDDAVSDDPVALDRLVAHIASHPENRYILGCHDDHGAAIAAALSRTDVGFQHGYIGPFGVVQLRQLVNKVGGGVAAHHVDRIMHLVFGEHLPRSPFLLVAVIAVLCANPSASPPNESKVLEAVIALLLGKHDPADTEAGLDARGREDLLQELAKHFVLNSVDRLERRDAEAFVLNYFEARGIEGSVSPASHLNVLIARKILVQDERGVGFRHTTFRDVVAATLMRVDREFDDVVLADPPRYTDVIRHASALSRDDRNLLKRVGDSTLPSIERAITRSVSLFDLLIGMGITKFGDEEIERLLAIASPKTASEQDHALEQHYEYREVREAAPLSFDLPTPTRDAIGASSFLSAVLAASELVDDVPLKIRLLKDSLRGWNAIAEELGQQGHEWISVRPLFDEVFKDVAESERETFWQFFMRTSLVVATAFGVAGTLGVRGLSAAVRALDSDEEIRSSPSLDFMLTLLFAELGLDGHIERFRATYDRHRDHLVVTDLIRTLATARYLSPHTKHANVQKLEHFLLDAMIPSPTGGTSVQDRSTRRSQLQTRLRAERARHRSDPIGAGLIDDILALDEDQRE